MIDMEKVRRESMRWILLNALNHARPAGTYESVLLPTLQTMYPDATALEIRRHLDYLSDRALVKVHKEPHGPWRALLTRHGIDIVEYTIDCEPGIARPEKYW
ncbi:hypothetical protein [Luteimonas terricola]|uniref:Uncharacterized protein n=1 Tax=Luteimonas terricola TaxID=645597 RepID=A0ABQ2EE38_9GAMM|nr:hypothetical protein [Luteimonas terricola]GGK08677.1 hypothetical protein GCM10011394_17580 [Luteimonas terricola]